MASPLFLQLARIQGDIQRSLGTLLTIQLIRLDRTTTSQDPVTSRPRETPPVTTHARIEGPDGIVIATDKTEPGARLKVTVYDPTLTIRADDILVIGGVRRIVRRVSGLARNAQLGRYVTVCEVV